MRFWLVFFVLLLMPGKALALDVETKDKNIEYGEETALSVSSEAEGDLWQLRAAAFPYRQSEIIGEWPTSRKSLPVRPIRNTKYRVFLIRDDQVVARSRQKMVWVEPRVENIARKTSSYLFVRGTLRFDAFFWTGLKALPRRQKRIYLYSRCSSDEPWVLQDSDALRIRLFKPRVYVAWQMGVTLPCPRAGYRTVGFFYFSNILPSGDEGLGQPAISRSDAQKARQLLGKKTLSQKTMEKYFPVS